MNTSGAAAQCCNVGDPIGEELAAASRCRGDWPDLDPRKIDWPDLDPRKMLEGLDDLDPRKIDWPVLDPRTIRWSDLDLSELELVTLDRPEEIEQRGHQQGGEGRDGGRPVRLAAGDLETLGIYLFGPRWQSARARDRSQRPPGAPLMRRNFYV